MVIFHICKTFSIKKWYSVQYMLGLGLYIIKDISDHAGRSPGKIIWLYNTKLYGYIIQVKLYGYINTS